MGTDWQSSAGGTLLALVASTRYAQPTKGLVTFRLEPKRIRALSQNVEAGEHPARQIPLSRGVNRLGEWKGRTCKPLPAALNRLAMAVPTDT